VVDHSQVAQAALLALGDDDAPTELSLRMDYRIEHILVDEFQDTAITQYELLQKLTRGWGDHNHLHPQNPRTLLIVGDGMQSIYGFRGANVGLFLRARQDGFNGVPLRHLVLDSNFRSDAGVVNWVNHAFASAFPPHDDAYRSQVSYSAAIAVRPAGSATPVEAHAFMGDTARAREIEFVCDAITRGLRIHNGSIAVLGRSRGHLQPIIQRLRQMQIPCDAPELDSLAGSPIVADLLTLCRALANEYDRLAWAALLRAPWCALGLADLIAVVGAAHEASVWTNLHSAAVHAQLSATGQHSLQQLLPTLQWAWRKRDRLSLRVWVEQTWLKLGGPACAGAREGLRDAESFLQLLEEADATGIGLDLHWLSTQVRRRFMASGDPDSRVQLLTLHKAKGLEFDQVFIVQLDRLPRQDGSEILLWDEHNTASGERAFLLAADDHSAARAPTLYNYLRQRRREKALMENTRLLYVGATRAVSRLVLTARVTQSPGATLHRDPPEQSLLRCIWPTFQAQMQVHETPVVSATHQKERTFPRLTRLRRPLPADVSAGAITDSARTSAPMTDLRSDHTLRSIGTVVHLALEELSRRAVLPESTGAADEQRWRVALQRLGVWGLALEEAIPLVRSAVSRCLQPQGSGRWLLSPGHTQAHSEWALTTVDTQGAIRDIVIDRSFIDPATGQRWIIDYKTGQPAPDEALEVFTRRQYAAHIDQLRLYRDAVRAVDAAPLRCALFFTALGLLHPLPELDLPAQEVDNKP
jgi:ATP-dependent exoDNAse (exonuclease V) beta subunit